MKAIRILLVAGLLTGAVPTLSAVQTVVGDLSVIYVYHDLEIRRDGSVSYKGEAIETWRASVLQRPSDLDRSFAIKSIIIGLTYIADNRAPLSMNQQLTFIGIARNSLETLLRGLLPGLTDWASPPRRDREAARLLGWLIDDYSAWPLSKSAKASFADAVNSARAVSVTPADAKTEDDRKWAVDKKNIDDMLHGSAEKTLRDPKADSRSKEQAALRVLNKGYEDLYSIALPIAFSKLEADLNSSAWVTRQDAAREIYLGKVAPPDSIIARLEVLKKSDPEKVVRSEASDALNAVKKLKKK